MKNPISAFSQRCETFRSVCGRSIITLKCVPLPTSREGVWQRVITSWPLFHVTKRLVHSLTSVSSASFNTSVQCDAKLAEIAFSGFLGNDEDLESICTTQCLTSLQKFRNQQNAVCSPSDVITAGGLPYPATIGVDQLLLSYNITCKRDP